MEQLKSETFRDTPGQAKGKSPPQTCTVAASGFLRCSAWEGTLQLWPHWLLGNLPLYVPFPSCLFLSFTSLPSLPSSPFLLPFLK